jgi:phosphoribosylformylglycinamidine synthase
MLRAEVFVGLKPVVNDPAGITILGGLHALGFDQVREVRSGKYLVLLIDDDDEERAKALVMEMAQKLLANAVIEDFRIEISPVREPSIAADGRR